jgi:hypothetical protein
MAAFEGGWSQYGYRPTGEVAAALSSNNDYRIRQGQNAAFQYGRQYDQEEHEKALQADEQRRRDYDSETQRQLGAQKNSILSGLLGGTRQLGGY